MEGMTSTSTSIRNSDWIETQLTYENKNPPDSIAVNLLLAASLRKANRFDEAMWFLENCINPKLNPALAGEGGSKNGYEPRIIASTPATKATPTWHYNYSLAETLVAKGHYSRAENEIRRC